MPEWRQGEYVVTTDKPRVDLDVVHRFISEESYWTRGRPRALTEQVVANSRCYSLLHEPSRSQVGFARALTDDVWFAWIGDVFVLREHRGGRGAFLMRCVMEDLADVRRVVLGTDDAQEFYRRYRFTPVSAPEHLMERFRR